MSTRAWLPPDVARCRPARHCDQAVHCCRALVPLPPTGGKIEDFTQWWVPLFMDCSSFIPVGKYLPGGSMARPVRPHIRGL